jgi:hypothetical protein
LVDRKKKGLARIGNFAKRSFKPYQNSLLLEQMDYGLLGLPGDKCPKPRRAAEHFFFHHVLKSCTPFASAAQTSNLPAASTLIR